MRYCTECGSAMSPELGYCTECGAKKGADEKVDGTPGARQGRESRSVNRQPPERPPRKPMTKKQKLLLGAAALLLLLLFGTHQFLQHYVDPVKDLQAMDEAVRSSNVEEFLRYIDFEDGTLLDEASYFAYIKEQEWDEVRDRYLELLEVEKENPSPLDQVLTTDDGEKLFIVKKDPLIFNLYPRYSLEAVPGGISLEVFMDETEVHIGDHTDTLNSGGPAEEIAVYPGTYPIKATSENDYGVFTYEDTVEVTAEAVLPMPIEFQTVTYTLNTNVPEATLFVDGEDTGKRLEDLEEIGPVPADQELELHAEWVNPEGEALRAEAEAGWGNSYSFAFEESGMAEEETAFADMSEEGEEVSGEAEEREAEEDGSTDELEAENEEGQEEEREAKETETATMELESVDAGDIVLVFRDAYENALNQKSFSFIEPYIQGGSQADSDLRTYIADLENTAFHYDFTSNQVLEVEEVDGETVAVTTNEQFTFTNHEGEVIDYDRDKEYTLTRENGTYRITDIEYLETNRDRQ
ncbi:hypothetical protein ACFOGI_05875 [Virgibacillus xinjiangensis]|uniref:Zinc ribbon domain-containing protein n=1 Tax=Virgibacillus xinjiangensis TaxID=393090 RepID=A0ABV7CU22_9BACI